MTDEEATLLCAEAVGLDALAMEQTMIPYEPLTERDQAMELVEMFPEDCALAILDEIHNAQKTAGRLIFSAPLSCARRRFRKRGKHEQESRFFRFRRPVLWAKGSQSA